MEGTRKLAGVLAEAVATLEAELARAADVLLGADLLVLEQRAARRLPCNVPGYSSSTLLGEPTASGWDTRRDQ